MSEELLKTYWQKGGDYVIPVPVINEWLCEYEELKQMLSLVNEMNITNYNKYCEALKVNEEHQKLNGQLMICISELEDRINKAVKYSENLLRELEKGTKLNEIAIIVTFRDILKG